MGREPGEQPGAGERSGERPTGQLFDAQEACVAVLLAAGGIGTCGHVTDPRAQTSMRPSGSVRIRSNADTNPLQGRHRRRIRDPDIPALAAAPGGGRQHLPHCCRADRGRRDRRRRPWSHHPRRGEAGRIRDRGPTSSRLCEERPISRPIASASTRPPTPIRAPRWQQLLPSPPTRSPTSGARLARLDRASSHGAWTTEVLQTIAARPAVRAADLAAGFGRETQPFKLDVRKLKNLGLTLSLEVGYRLSPAVRRSSPPFTRRRRGSNRCNTQPTRGGAWARR